MKVRDISGDVYSAVGSNQKEQIILSSPLTEANTSPNTSLTGETNDVNVINQTGATNITADAGFESTPIHTEPENNEVSDGLVDENNDNTDETRSSGTGFGGGSVGGYTDEGQPSETKTTIAKVWYKDPKKLGIIGAIGIGLFLTKKYLLK